MLRPPRTSSLEGLKSLRKILKTSWNKLEIRDYVSPGQLAWRNNRRWCSAGCPAAPPPPDCDRSDRRRWGSCAPRTLIISSPSPSRTVPPTRSLPHTNNYFRCHCSYLDLLPQGPLGYPRGAKPPCYTRRLHFVVVVFLQKCNFLSTGVPLGPQGLRWKFEKVRGSWRKKVRERYGKYEKVWKTRMSKYEKVWWSWGVILYDTSVVLCPNQFVVLMLPVFHDSSRVLPTFSQAFPAKACKNVGKSRNS